MLNSSRMLTCLPMLMVFVQDCTTNDRVVPTGKIYEDHCRPLEIVQTDRRSRQWFFEIENTNFESGRLFCNDQNIIYGTPDNCCIDRGKSGNCCTNADCLPEETCLCTSHIPFPTHNKRASTSDQCVRKTCTSSDDCGGQQCKLSLRPTPETPTVTGFFCATKTDSCDKDSQCKENEKCLIDDASLNWRCIKIVPQIMTP